MHKKIVPAVWFQNHLTPPPASPPTPRVLQLMESQLVTVTGGLIIGGDTLTYVNGGIPNDNADG
jgi:hypothetical protein